MKHAIRAAWLIVLLIGTPAGSLVHAQAATGSSTSSSARVPGEAPADSIEIFLRAVMRSAERYADRAVAVREGYRRVGPDFPGMGEHWVQPGRMVSGRFDAAAPPLLTYATIRDSIVLTGVAFAVPLAPGVEPPGFPAPGYWHDHSGSVDEESLLIAPAGTRHGHGLHDSDDAPGPRLAMLHVWILKNPDGVFAQHNWALPYARLGLVPPARVDPAAARALSFASGGDAYYRQLFRAAVRLVPEEAAVLDSLTESLRAQVQEWVARERQHVGPNTDAAGTPDLAKLWSAWWERVEQSVSEAVWHELVRFGPSHS